MNKLYFNIYINDNIDLTSINNHCERGLICGEGTNDFHYIRALGCVCKILFILPSISAVIFCETSIDFNAF
jgi:hypothetical protein